MSPRSVAPTPQTKTTVRPKPAMREATVSTAISAAAPASRPTPVPRGGLLVSARAATSVAPAQRVEFPQPWRPIDHPGEAHLLARRGEPGERGPQAPVGSA